MRLLTLLPIALILLLAHLIGGQSVRCPASNGCRCAVGTLQGQYCWACPQVLTQGRGSGDYTGWVFECNSSGGCCAYGPRRSCADGARNPCGPRHDEVGPKSQRPRDWLVAGSMKAI